MMATEPMFTRGPWQWFPSVSRERSAVIDTALGVDSENGTIIAEVMRGKQFEANANLIAAAPRLYERVHSSNVALEEAAKLLEGNGLRGCAGIMRGYIVGNEAALELARGEHPSDLCVDDGEVRA